jgi:hypothetical protein
VRRPGRRRGRLDGTKQLEQTDGQRQGLAGEAGGEMVGTPLGLPRHQPAEHLTHGIEDRDRAASHQDPAEQRVAPAGVRDLVGQRGAPLPAVEAVEGAP